ncbi:hypothetical protein AGLY_003293 [Aphis glycines]|uniref:Uncharacterized protein n=1 Tax=Aphis glycines TaxID=307491 RepID=A0A6G0U2B7_APHGL|nr:hypothetical protein AGLY_003293 [Aphis glycines]
MAGILGIPFFNKYDVTLNIRKGVMIIETQQNKENLISIPPTSNNILTINFTNKNINNGVSILINKTILSDSVWLENSILKFENNTILANVIYISEKCVKLPELKSNKFNWELYSEKEINEELEYESDNTYKNTSIIKLAIPKIMTDLNYEIIRSLLRYIFKGSDIKIQVYTDYKISEEVKLALITEQHMTCIGGHQGRLKSNQKNNYDKHINPIELEIGDKVLMKNIKNKNKLEPNWIGPYEVVEVHEPVNVSIIKNNKIVRKQAFRKKRKNMITICLSVINTPTHGTQHAFYNITQVSNSRDCILRTKDPSGSLTHNGHY